MPEKLLVINSKDRIRGTNSDFTVQFNDSVSQEVLRVLVKDIFIPNQFYNITELNNTFEYIQGISFFPVNFTIDPGQYNIITLMFALKEKLDNLLIDGAIVTITKNDATHKLTFTLSGAVNPVNNQWGISYPNTTMREIIGYTVASPSTSTTIVMPSSWNLNPLQYVQVHSQDLASDHGMDAGSNTTIALLETVSLVETGFGGVAHRQNNDDELSEILYDDQRQLNQITIRLRDSEGQLLTLPGNHYVTIIVKAYY